MKILIIEDEILIQKSLKRLLEKRGAAVDVATFGQDAITMINSNNYQRIICDLMLKDISGFDIIEESKKKFSLEQIKNIFIIITAYSSPQVIERASRYKCKIISKPFEDLELALNIFMDNQGMA
ncbi:MAG: response regulator [Bdellovibrionales bacterium]|jgi:CheY-like chemotaxis protein|nr:response regulator [Bdellovibrionales bacterium]MBT3526066.1 response regulator [Bdellovibrionales bacterium]MBT7669984.1 response regulator [Bdellovibrionales bacterium]MBT7768083.1 response regulator [Bdellovibrionales bacterium]